MNQKIKKEAKQFIAGLLGAATVFTTSACASEVECNIDKTHSHTYTNNIEELINLGYEYIIYHKLYLAYDRETNEFIGYEDEIGSDKVTRLVLKKQSPFDGYLNVIIKCINYEKIFTNY